MTGRWFTNRYFDFGPIGWEWAVFDTVSKIFIGNNKNARFPISNNCCVISLENIEFDPDDLNNFQSFGIYYQSIGKNVIGKGTYIGPNVGLITANYDMNDLDRHLEAEPIELGEKCWIGMNTVILPGVTLGPNTIVGAGSVVTKSFPKGNCVIAGNPAKVLHQLNSKEEQ